LATSDLIKKHLLEIEKPKLKIEVDVIPEGVSNAEALLHIKDKIKV
jgi:hypothetical protein